MALMRKPYFRRQPMIAPNDKPQYRKSSVEPIEPTTACVNMTYDARPVAPGEQSPAKPVEPTMISVNMIYDSGPITQAERAAARSFIESVGGLERAKEILRHMHQPLDASE